MKRIVVIGASSGLGNAIARAYAERGWRVGVAARREEPLRRLREEYPGQLEYAVFDTAAPEAPGMLAELIGRLGGMDIFLQAAGCGSQNPLLTDSTERLTVSTNCIGFTAMVDAAFRYFAANATGSSRGRIAAITSVAGTKGLGVAPSYSASKAYQSTYLTALEQLAQIRRLPIDFTDIRPGFIATDLLDPSDSYPMLMQPGRVVPKIVRALDRRRRIATIDWRWRCLTAAWRRLPRWLWVRIKATTDRTMQ